MTTTVKAMIAKSQAKKKVTFTGADALALADATDVHSKAGKVKKAKTADFKAVNPDEKLHVYKKHGVSVQAKVTYNMVWDINAFLKDYPELKDVIKSQKYYKKQKKVTLNVERIGTKVPA